ncbi:MAG: hypothetical protein RLZZ587_156, partial [Actinomycetota bacterium]
MSGLVRGLEALAGNVRVNLGSSDASVAQYFLNATQISATVQQMRC